MDSMKPVKEQYETYDMMSHGAGEMKQKTSATTQTGTDKLYNQYQYKRAALITAMIAACCSQEPRLQQCGPPLTDVAENSWAGGSAALLFTKPLVAPLARAADFWGTDGPPPSRSRSRAGDLCFF